MLEADFELPDWAPVVLAHTQKEDRPPLAVLLAFDLRLMRIAQTVSEPMLGQVRMAWWREEIARDRPEDGSLPPDPLLSAIIERWAGHPRAPLGLLDGWENLLTEPPFTAETCERFCAGRAGAFSGFAELVGEGVSAQAAALHGSAWGTSNIIAHAENPIPTIQSLPRLPRRLRPLAMIGGLSARSIRRGGGPLMGDRGSPLAALRLGIFGI